MKKRIGLGRMFLCMALVWTAPAPGEARGAETTEEKTTDMPENLAAEGWTPLLWAIRLGREEEVRERVARGEDVNARNDEGWSPLFMAADMGNVALFEFLCRHTADVQVRDPNGNTPLHYAAAYGLTEPARELMGKGAEVNAGRNNGSTPLHLAAWYGQTEMAALLLAHDAEIEAESDDGTPLHMAAYGGHLDTARLLLEKGAEVNARDPRRNTPMHYAMDAGHQALADFLVGAGADPEAENEDGLKPTTPPDRVPIVFDHTDREAVIGLVTSVEAAFYRSIEEQDMTGFREVISKQWQEAMTLGDMNEAFKLLMMLDTPHQFWKGPGLVLDRLPYLLENGTLAVNLRYPTPGEHVFVSHVYFPENGEWKMGAYNLSFRPYNEVWERHHGASLDHFRAGEYERAIEEANRTLRIAAALDPPEPRLTLIAAETLADMYLGLQEFEESLRFRLLLLDLLLRTAGMADPRVPGQLDQLAGVYVLLGHLDKVNLCSAWAEDLRAAAAGDPDAARRIETELDLDRLRTETPEVPPEDPKLTALREKAEAGDARAQYDLSSAYDAGRYGLEKDRVLSAEWALRAAEQGLASAQQAMAIKYEYGSGVEKDLERAAAWCLRAAEQGWKTSLYKMGTFYETGKGVPQDTEKALAWYRRAEEAGMTVATKRIEALEP